MTSTQTPPAPGAATTGTCPLCNGTFDTCRCRGCVAVLDRPTETIPSPTAGGGYGGMEEDDNAKGFERDETDQFHQVVRRLTDQGDRRAAVAGRRARRTLAEMAPGQSRQPVLRMVDRPLVFLPTTAARSGADDACVLCGRWLCGGNCYAPAPSLRTVAS
ncbi:hypothetical protein [Streptomyces griseus]|uniref:hypothetical protein n=1 Tax=Streptomyces griseus TaxID=1911 RepID=UPI00365C2206